MIYTDLDTFTTHYLIAAMWSTSDESTDDGGNPIDDTFYLCDFYSDALASARKDCNDFRAQAGDLLNGIDEEQAGHDFWMTREGHGVGFWDRDLGEIGDKLSNIATGFGNGDLYVGDDDMLHFMGE